MKSAINRSFPRFAPRRWPLLAVAAAPAAQAHSFGQVYNLPVPFSLYAWGAAAVLALSFVVAAGFAAAPAALHEHARSERAWTPVPGPLLSALKILSASGLLLCILTGFFGTSNPYRNFNMTFFWVVFVLGFTYLSALIGDVYALVNPWKLAAQALTRRHAGYGRGWFRYPARLASWPALAFYMAFIGIELFAYVKPLSLASILLAYSVVNFLGVGLFGCGAWFERCEFFGVFFRLIARLAPLEWRASEQGGAGVRRRAPFAAVLEPAAGSTSVLVFVLFMLSSTGFDGLRETVPWVNLFWRDFYHALAPWVGSNPIQAYPLLRPLYFVYEIAALLLSPFLYLAMYALFITLAKILARSERPIRELALRFAFTLLPIALVYNLSHYLTLLLNQGTQIVSLASDPFGRGWNLFGTANWLRAPIIAEAGLVWHLQVGLIVAGHVLSVWLAHRQALRIFPTRRQATLSQLPMLALMVVFTTAGLWILAQPIQHGH